MNLIVFVLFISIVGIRASRVLVTLRTVEDLQPHLKWLLHQLGHQQPFDSSDFTTIRSTLFDLFDIKIFNFSTSFIAYSVDIPDWLEKLVKGRQEVEDVEISQTFKIWENINSMQMNIITEQPTKNWALGRIDDRSPGNLNQFRYVQTAGENTTIYILDTGIQIYHQEFLEQGVDPNQCPPRLRATFGTSFVNPQQNISPAQMDENGHGTFVAALAVGNSVGVAKRARVVAVQVLDAQGQGSSDQILQGFDWTLKEIQNQKQDYGYSVINMSFGSAFSRTINRAVNSISDMGIPVVVAAGNEGISACLTSPASAGGAICAGSTNRNDRLSSFSNTGSCVDILAPGEDVTSAAVGDLPVSGLLQQPYCPQLLNSYGSASGTSFSSPITAGTLAIYLTYQRNRFGRDAGFSSNWKRVLTQEQATRDEISGIGFLSRTPNQLVYSFPPGLGVGQ